MKRLSLVLILIFLSGCSLRVREYIPLLNYTQKFPSAAEKQGFLVGKVVWNFRGLAWNDRPDIYSLRTRLKNLESEQKYAFEFPHEGGTKQDYFIFRLPSGEYEFGDYELKLNEEVLKVDPMKSDIEIAENEVVYVGHIIFKVTKSKLEEKLPPIQLENPLDISRLLNVKQRVISDPVDIKSYLDSLGYNKNSDNFEVKLMSNDKFTISDVVKSI